MSHRRARIIAASAHDFVQFGCGQCHGMDGSGGVPPYVPALDTLGSSLTAAQRSSIIEHGAGLSANPTHPYMPIWRGILSQRQISIWWTSSTPASRPWEERHRHPFPPIRDKQSGGKRFT